MRRIKLQLQEVCPHADYMHGVVHSMFARNHRTTNYHCAACGAVLRDRVQVEEALEYWTENIEEFERRRRQCLEMIDKFSP